MLNKLRQRYTGASFSAAQVNKKYSEISCCHDPREFIRAVLNILNITYEIKGKGIESIPQEGPLIIIANHPFGAIEGILPASILNSVRTDTKLLGNYVV